MFCFIGIRGHGNQVVLDSVSGPLQAERYARNLTIEMGGSVALAMPVITGSELKQFVIRKTLSLAIAIGEAVLNARTKDTIIYNGKKYTNQQPKEDGETWRHDLYHELVVGGKHQYVYPYIVVINGEHQNVKYIPGFYPAIRLKRSLNQIIK